MKHKKLCSLVCVCTISMVCSSAFAFNVCATADNSVETLVTADETTRAEGLIRSHSLGIVSGVSIVLPRYLTGTLYDYNDYRMTVESTIPYGGSSGCAVYCDDGNLDVVIGIIQSTGKHGMVISRPLLEFYLHP